MHGWGYCKRSSGAKNEPDIRLTKYDKKLEALETLVNGDCPIPSIVQSSSAKFFALKVRIPRPMMDLSGRDKVTYNVVVAFHALLTEKAIEGSTIL